VKREALKILIVDDDAGMRFFLDEALRKDGYRCEAVHNGQEALDRLEKERFPLVLMDIKMPKLGGLAALDAIKRRHPDTIVILMTAFGSKTVAIEAIEKGAYDYFTKPFDLEEMRIVLKRAVERFRLQDELRILREGFEALRPLIVAESAEMKEVLELVDKVASSDITVLITGESGTGKELVAREIHYRSTRSPGPFAVVNCAAIPEALLEAELFGHEKGAFTGAHQQKPGKFELANGGTIFLDEIGDLPLATQSKILRVLQEREIDRVGGTSPVGVDIRFIAATNRDLQQLTSAGQFREDLFFRLNGFSITLPPLRDRSEDIPPLVGRLLSHYSRELKKKEPEISPPVLDQLMRYRWPGNVRELENILQRAVLVATEGAIDERVLAEILPRTAPGSESSGAGHTLKSRVGEARSAAERTLIAEALRKEKGKRTAAAQRLGISRKNLYNKMRKYGLL
jgi:two-component system, NtrC family, response regulator AtoC